MNNKKVVIIGSGLGGLSTGVILAKNGYQVTVLEQGIQIGGCLQCFVRRGAKFETGMHFIGSAAPGQVLDQLMHFLEINDKVKLSSLDPTGYDMVSLKGERFKFPMGRQRFIDQMSEYFPDQHDNLVRYCDMVERVANASSIHAFKYAESTAAVDVESQIRSINDVIEEIITDPKLAKVLVSQLPLYGAERDKTPFSTHAFIMDFYNKSAYRIVGGSDCVADALVGVIEKYGGKVLSKQKVSRILCDDTHATGVETVDGNLYEADIVISSAHPQRTVEMLGDTSLIRQSYRRRISAIPQTMGSFTLYIHFKDGKVPYMNYNFYSFKNDTPWYSEVYDETTWPKGYFYMHHCSEEGQKWGKSAVLMSYMKLDDCAKWIGTKVGQRGQDYEEFKARKTEQLLELLENDFPGIRENIEHVYSSTPLTYYDYTGTEGGSMYGIAKDINLGAACRVSHKTRIPNLLLTGQNVNSHGMLGVLVGSIVTCSELLTSEKIYNQIIESNK